jgi:hypothetical protein
MSAFAVLAPGRTCNLGLLGVNGNNLQIRADEKKIEFPAGRLATPGFDHPLFVDNS